MSMEEATSQPTIQQEIKKTELRPLFQPTNEFWRYLAKVPKSVRLIDVDMTLIGPDRALAEEAVSRGLNVEWMNILDAQEFHGWGRDVWPLIIRPSGKWSHPVILNARRSGATTMYFGVYRNYYRDIGQHIAKRIFGKYGHESERLYLIPPDPAAVIRNNRSTALS